MTQAGGLAADAAATLAAWSPPTTGQAVLRARYLAHLQAHPDGVYRRCRPDHLTAGTLVLSAAHDRVLLNLHGKAGRWFAFGGHCEPADRTLAQAAHREALEESGLPSVTFDPVPVHLDEHEVGFCGPGGLVRHLDVRYVAVASTHARPAGSVESLAVRWWPLTALPELEREMHELIRLALTRVTGQG